MKKLLILASLIIIMILSVVGSVSAALPGSGWWTSFSVQNISQSEGTVEMIAYAASTTETYPSDKFTFSPSRSLIYNPGRAVNYPTGNSIGFISGLPSGFEGSVVLAGNVPLAAAAEIGNYPNGTVGVTGGTASAQYQAMGTDITDTQLRVPTVKHNYRDQTTSIYVQAAGADADVTVTFKMNNGSEYSQNVLIEANRMFMFDPANAGVPATNCGSDPNISQCFGAATIVSTSGLIAASYVEHPHIGSPSPIALSTRAQTSADESTILYGASVKNTYTTGAGTGITGDTIMNVGNDDALVQISLIVTKLGKNAPSTVSVGDVFTDTEVIEPGKSVVFSQWDDNLGGMPEGTFASATYESLDTSEYDPQPLVGASNDAKTQPLISGGKGKTVYKLFADTTATEKAAVPIVKEYLDDITGALTVQNVGTSPVTIYFEYYEFGSGSDPYEFWTTNQLSPGEAINTYGISKNTGGAFTNDGSWNFSEMYGKEFSVVVSATEPLICLVSENSPNGDFDIRNYEAFNIFIED
jgi:hypothetical protein